MPTVRTVTVKSSGGDYSSLAAAEAGEQGNLVSLDRQLTIECYASAAGDSTQVTIDGWTTDATRYVRVVCPAGERHAGAWDAAKYHLSLTTVGSPGGAITNSEDYTRLEYLQVRNTIGSPGAFDCGVYDTANGILVDGCILRGGYTGAKMGSNGDLRNTIAYGCSHSGAFINANATTIAKAQNCTLIGGEIGLETSADTNYPLAKNVYGHGSTGGFYGQGTLGAFVNKTNCMSSDTTATINNGGATNCTNSVGHNTTNFTNVTGGSEDYRLPSGSALIDAGVDLSGTFTNDLDGTTRSGTFDVGADEFAGGGGSFGDGSGSSSLTFAASGTGASLADATGSTALAFTPTGAGSSLADATSSVAMTFAASAAGSALADASCASSLTFAAAADGSSLADATGSSSLTFAASASSDGGVDATGSSSLTFAATATGAALADATGSAALSFAPSAAGASYADAIGSASLTFTVTGVAPGGVGAAVSASAGIRPRAGIAAGLRARVNATAGVR